MKGGVDPLDIGTGVLGWAMPDPMSSPIRERIPFDPPPHTAEPMDYSFTRASEYAARDKAWARMKYPGAYDVVDDPCIEAQERRRKQWFAKKPYIARAKAKQRAAIKAGKIDMGRFQAPKKWNYDPC